MKALISDLAEFVALEQACFTEPWTEKNLADALADENYLFLIERNEAGSPLGYLIGRQIGPEAELDRIAVPLALRGQGHAKKLLDDALQIWHANGVLSVFLEVRSSNENAIGLYASRGFEIISRRTSYYENGEDALIMRLQTP